MAVDLVRKVAVLLRAVASSEPAGITTAAAARAVDLPRPTVHRLLHSLHQEGLVDRSDDGARWVLGPDSYVLGRVSAARYDVSANAQPVVRRLSLATGESAFYSTWRGEETVCLIAEEGSFPLRSHVLHVGKRLPLGVASAGIVVLAFLSRADADAYLTRVDLTVDYGEAHSAEKVSRRLSRTRRTGYSVNPGLVVPGSWGMAAAVLDAGGRPLGALSLTGVQTRFAHSRIPELGSLLLRGAHELSEKAAVLPGRPTR